MASLFNYVISTGTANGVVDTYALEKAISSSSITIALDYITATVSADDLEIQFKADISAGEETTLDGIVAAHDGVAINDPDQVEISNDYIQAQTIKPVGKSDGTKVSHDFCDKTTWYEQSTEHTGITLADQGSNKFKHADHTHWIDLTHGKIYDEDSLADQKEPVVYDNGVEQTAGFTIDYTEGSVTFDSAPTGPVTADFWKGGSSVYTIAPDAGKKLLLEHAEVQFAKNISMTSPMKFEIWVYNPLDLPNKFAYRSTKYKNIKDFINIANMGQGTIPAVDILTQETVVFPFNYVSVKELLSSQGAEIRVSTVNDQEYGGEWATASFYFISEDE